MLFLLVTIISWCTSSAAIVFYTPSVVTINTTCTIPFRQDFDDSKCCIRLVRISSSERDTPSQNSDCLLQQFGVGVNVTFPQVGIFVLQAFASDDHHQVIGKSEDIRVAIDLNENDQPITHTPTSKEILPQITAVPTSTTASSMLLQSPRSSQNSDPAPIIGRAIGGAVALVSAAFAILFAYSRRRHRRKAPVIFDREMMVQRRSPPSDPESLLHPASMEERDTATPTPKDSLIPAELGS